MSKKPRDFTHLLRDFEETPSQDDDEAAAMKAMLGFGAFGQQEESQQEIDQRRSDLLNRARREPKQGDAAADGSTLGDDSRTERKKKKDKKKKKHKHRREGEKLGDDAEQHVDAVSSESSSRSGRVARADGMAVDASVESTRSPGTATSGSRHHNEHDHENDDDDDDDISEEDGEDKEAAEDEDEEESVLGIPVSHEVELKHGSKPILTITVDPSGSRLVSGSADYEIKFWEFNSMDTRLKSFRTLIPNDGYPVRCLQFSNTGDGFIVGTGSPLYKVMDREGVTAFEAVRGDIYIYDRKLNKGHVSAVTSCLWHPRNRDLYLTASHDGTVRLWNLANEGKKSVVAGLARNKAKNTPLLSMTINRAGSMIACGAENGLIFVFSSSERLIRQKSMAQCHDESSEVCSVKFATDGRRLISRATDGTLKMWDVYAMKSPKFSLDNLPCFYNSTTCCFSPDEKYVLTGTSVEGQAEGALVIVRTETFEKIRQIGVGPRAVISVLWHLKLNQIFVGCSDGTVKIFFNPQKSTKGAMMCASRKPRAADPLDLHLMSVAVAEGYAYSNVHNEMRRTAKKRKEKARRDPVLSHKPEEPVKTDRGVGAGGRLMGFSNSIHAYIATRTAYDPTRDQDPREEILKYADKAEKEPFFINRAYAETQPKPIYDMVERPEDDDDDDDDQSKKKHKGPN